jgi:REP-associated tyrosine transposase
MPTGLKRFYGTGNLHFITSSCYQRQPLLDIASRRDLFLQVLEQVRQNYRFVVVGYVVMPEHFHMLVGEPEKGDPSVVMQVLKQNFAKQVLEDAPQRGKVFGDRHIWQRRFYDFVTWSEKKRIEKLLYMHNNPVKRGLVSEPEAWAWSSYRFYAFNEAGLVMVNEQVRAKLKIRNPSLMVG